MHIWQRIGALFNKLINFLLCVCGAMLFFWALFSVDLSGARWVLFAMGTGLSGAGGYFFWREKKGKYPGK
jgi:hypothetical protein